MSMKHIHGTNWQNTNFTNSKMTTTQIYKQTTNCLTAQSNATIYHHITFQGISTLSQYLPTKWYMNKICQLVHIVLEAKFC